MVYRRGNDERLDLLSCRLAWLKIVPSINRKKTGGFAEPFSEKSLRNFVRSFPPIYLADENRILSGLE
jgi:hypothetical protein